MIKPAILVALLFRTLDAFRIFDNIYVLTGGANDTGSVSILGYDNLFKAFNLGLGSAISVLIFLWWRSIAFVFIKLFGAAAPGADGEGALTMTDAGGRRARVGLGRRRHPGRGLRAGPGAVDPVSLSLKPTSTRQGRQADSRRDARSTTTRRSSRADTVQLGA